MIAEQSVASGLAEFGVHEFLEFRQPHRAQVTRTAATAAVRSVRRPATVRSMRPTTARSVRPHRIEYPVTDPHRIGDIGDPGGRGPSRLGETRFGQHSQYRRTHRLRSERPDQQ